MQPLFEYALVGEEVSPGCHRPQCWGPDRHLCWIARDKMDGSVAVVSNGGDTRAGGAKVALELLEALVQVS